LKKNWVSGSRKLPKKTGFGFEKTWVGNTNAESGFELVSSTIGWQVMELVRLERGYKP